MDRRPAVLLLGPDLRAVSGVSTHLAMLLDSALGDSVDLSHFQVGSEGRQESRLAAALRLLASPLLLSRAITRYGIDVVHVNSSLNKAFWRDCAYVAVARLRRRRIVFQVHGGDLPEAFAGAAFTRWLVSAVLRGVDVVVLLAEAERLAYSRFVPRARLRLVPNAIPLPPADRSTASGPTAGTDGPVGRLQLVYVGRMLRSKGMLEAVDAVHLLRERGVHVDFALAGSGTDEQAVSRLVAERGLQDRVRLLGPVFGAAKQRLWDSSDVFVFPTYHQEGLPYALLEAMAAGAVPVTCAVGAIPDVVVDGRHGFLVPPRDARAVADRVEWLHQHRRALAEAAQAGAQRVRESYSVDRLAADFAEVYRDVNG